MRAHFRVATAISAMAWRAAELLDANQADDDAGTETIAALAAAARETGARVEAQVEDFINTWDIEVPTELAIATRDLVKTLGIAGTARDLQARKRGQALLAAANE